jgi:aspartyl protease family protein
MTGAMLRWGANGTPIMQHILVFAIIALVLAAVAPRWLSPRNAEPVVVATATPEAAPARTIAIARGENGHFSVDARVDGRRISFLVDTGATTIALREGDAAWLGIHPAARDYTARISTANGSVMAAPIELNRVEAGDLTVRNVTAIVLPDEALSQNLLGMSFLSHVRWQYQGSKLVLEQ